jgi:hypothetical protein
MVKAHKEWEHIYFTASKKGLDPIRVELAFNHISKQYTLCTKHQEGVFFNGDTIEQSKLKLEAIKAAIKHIETQLL